MITRNGRAAVCDTAATLLADSHKLSTAGATSGGPYPLDLSACELAHFAALSRDEERRTKPAPMAIDTATLAALAERGRRYLDLIDRVISAAKEMAEEGVLTEEEIAGALIDAAMGIESAFPGVKAALRGLVVSDESCARLTKDEAAEAVGLGLAQAVRHD